MAGHTLFCFDCSKKFCDSSALKDHHRRNHRAPLLSCHHCPFTTKFKFHLSNHINKNHVDLNRRPLHGHAGTKSRKVPTLTCPLCQFFQCEYRSEMLQHYVTAHDIDLTEKNISFSDAEEFSRWKKENEASGSFRFVKNTTNENRDNEVKYFRCFRDGFFRSSGQGKRRLKIKGSCKTNGVCPCSLKVMISKVTGRVTVSYVSSHVGHTLDIGGMKLIKEQRRSTAQKLSEPVPFDVLLDAIRESTIDGKYQRMHLTTRKDLANIKKSFQLFQVTDGRSPSDDRTSLEAWMKTATNYSNLVRFHKPQSIVDPEHPELLEEDFVLILAYDAQIEFLVKYGSGVVCFDGTHGTNAYNFELHTLLAKDDSGEGFPCAFLITNRSDSQVMELFCKVIGNLLPKPLQPKVLMSDMSDIYHNGWCAALPKPENWFFCQWHVDQQWRRDLNKIRDPNKKCLVYKLLRTLMDEPDELTFSQLLDRALAFMASDPALTNFEQSFRSQYSNSYRSWALCHQKYLEINTNMMLESMHTIIKYVYCDGKKVKRLDEGINALLQYVRDKFCNQLIASTRDDTMSNIRERHAWSISLRSTIISNDAEPSWLISSSSCADMYKVTKTGILCNCEQKCEDCQVCVHEYRCTCFDSMRSNLCEHIHRIVTFCNQDKVLVLPTEEKPMGAGDLLIGERSDHLEAELVKHILSANNPAVNASFSDLARAKEALSNEFSNILNLVENMDGVEVVNKALAPIIPTLQALASGLVFKPHGSSKNVNPCAKISPQKPLYSTKKARKNNDNDQEYHLMKKTKR